MWLQCSLRHLDSIPPKADSPMPVAKMALDFEPGEVILTPCPDRIMKSSVGIRVDMTAIRCFEDTLLPGFPL